MYPHTQLSFFNFHDTKIFNIFSTKIGKLKGNPKFHVLRLLGRYFVVVNYANSWHSLQTFDV